MVYNITEKGNAKVNLWLGVGAKRDDGFHEIQTVMQSVSLCDDIIITVGEAEKFSVSVNCGGEYIVPCGDDNLAARAARAFFGATGIGFSAEIYIHKRIPVFAGLGGGSADAAAVIRGLNKIFGRVLGREELLRVAGTVGADVPFCLIGGCAICKGKGERVTSLNCGGMHFLICPSPEKVSTAKAYDALDRTLLMSAEELTHGCEKFCRSLYNGAANICGNMYNSFERAVFDECPVSQRNKDRLLTHGAMGALLSGSGSSVFGIFSDEESAKAAQRCIPGAVYAVSEGPALL